jgi:hypothetical protein
LRRMEKLLASFAPCGSGSNVSWNTNHRTVNSLRWRQLASLAVASEHAIQSANYLTIC